MKFTAPFHPLSLIATVAALDQGNPNGVQMAAEMRQDLASIPEEDGEWDDGVIAGGLMIIDNFNPLDMGNVERNEDGSLKYEPGLEVPHVALLGTYTRNQLLAIVIEMSEEVKSEKKGDPT